MILTRPPQGVAPLKRAAIEPARASGDAVWAGRLWDRAALGSAATKTARAAAESRVLRIFPMLMAGRSGVIIRRPDPGGTREGDLGVTGDVHREEGDLTL
jgi:hypothetical protein